MPDGAPLSNDQHCGYNVLPSGWIARPDAMALSAAMPSQTLQIDQLVVLAGKQRPNVLPWPTSLVTVM